jgi:N-acetylglutamate synthase-like GNAT family acetyltransferase
MMNTRLLPPQEWSRLAGTELERVWPVLNPDHSEIMVVEEGTEIVACWAILTYTHLEGIWIAPAHRKGSVGGRLLRAVFGLLKDRQIPAVLTASMSDEVTRLIEHFGGSELPGSHFVLKVS